MLSLVPLPYRILGAAALAGLLALTCYVGGRKSKQGELDALRRSYELAVAQAAGARKQQEKMWQEAITTAGAKYDERTKIADASFDSSLNRLRDAYASSARLRLTPKDAGSCQESGRATAADLLAKGEELARLVQSADRDRAALISCVQAWPR